jgi:RNA recognition motif. (a.k.a. RRM, RBD, or RNP domain)
MVATDTSSAVDDLDAFFDEVEEEVQAESTNVDTGQHNDGEEGAPPSKKQRIDEPPRSRPPVRPVGVMVAAAASGSSAVVTEESVTNHVLPAVPPPPPPPAPENPSAAAASANSAPKPPVRRRAGGQTWIDPTLADWPTDDFRLFVGNLGPEVTDEQFHQHFAKYSVQRTRVVRKNQVSQGYGFVSFDNPRAFAQALREMDQTWLGARPIRVKKSSHQEKKKK